MNLAENYTSLHHAILADSDYKVLCNRDERHAIYGFAVLVLGVRQAGSKWSTMVSFHDAQKAWEFAQAVANFADSYLGLVGSKSVDSAMESGEILAPNGSKKAPLSPAP